MDDYRENITADIDTTKKKIIIGVLSGFIIAVCFFFCVCPINVHGMSMNPTYKDGDIIHGRRIFITPAYEDVVVFRFQGISAIKRVIGLPYDEIKIKDGVVFRNNEKLSEPYATGKTLGDMSISLKEDEYFVMGDNREHSSDSRLFGPIKRDNINIIVWTL